VSFLLFKCLRLTIVFFFGCEPFARRYVIWEHNDCNDGNQNSSTAFDHEEDAPRLEFDVDEGDTVGNDAVDETTGSC
jgi:hypothetical protein